VPQVTQLLRDAEALEARAATERVAFLTRLFGNDARVGLRLLDVGCGNGYSVAEWNDRGLVAVGVDVSLYRLSRWINEHPPDRRPFVIADAAALPFVDRAFDKVVSSGMIEHVGVSESSAPYTITPDPDQSAKRRQVIAELVRIDFWHGDGLGAFRIHGVPDVLLPSYSDLRLWAGRCDARAVLRPLTGRLAFRQVGSRWWGRALAPMMRVYLRILDTLTRFGLGRLVVPLYPYLVIEIRLDSG